MKCSKCGKALNQGDTYQHAGQTLCEDCYFDIMATPRVCDPWAVYSAKKMSKDKSSLTPLQKRILSLIEKRPLTAEEICHELNITESEFRANFAALRHMELAKATKQGGKVYYVPFKQ